MTLALAQLVEGYFRPEILKNNFDISLISSVFSYIFKFKGQKNIDIENFDNLFLTVPEEHPVASWEFFRAWIVDSF